MQGGSGPICSRRRRRRRVLPVDDAALGAVGENVVGPEGADVVQGPLDEGVPPCKIGASSDHLHSVRITTAPAAPRFRHGR